MNPKKQNKVYVLTFYSIFNMSRKPKYKMICLNSPKSSEFAKKTKTW